MSESYPCKARVTVLDSLSGVKIIDNNFIHCNDIDTKFTNSRYIVTVHERVYAQKYLDEQEAIKEIERIRKEQEAQNRQDERDARALIAEQERQEEIIFNEEIKVLEVTVETPISDIPISTPNTVTTYDIAKSNVYIRTAELLFTNKTKSIPINMGLVALGIASIFIIFKLKK